MASPAGAGWLDRSGKCAKFSSVVFMGEPMFRSSRIWIAAIGLAVLAVLPASADIKTFNEKVGARDFKAAAAEAAATWPTLDKSRKDIAIIAREFGFAAYMAGDFSAARTFAEF